MKKILSKLFLHVKTYTTYCIVLLFFFILYISHDPSLFCFLCSFVYTFVEPRIPMNCMVFSELNKRIDLNYY